MSRIIFTIEYKMAKSELKDFTRELSIFETTLNSRIDRDIVDVRLASDFEEHGEDL